MATAERIEKALEKIKKFKEFLDDDNNVVNSAVDKKIRQIYTLSNGKVFTDKMACDLIMWKDFAHDYGLDRKGGIMLLRQILGDEDEFKDKYIN